MANNNISLGQSIKNDLKDTVNSVVDTVTTGKTPELRQSFINRMKPNAGENKVTQFVNDTLGSVDPFKGKYQLNLNIPQPTISAGKTFDSSYKGSAVNNDTTSKPKGSKVPVWNRGAVKDTTTETSASTETPAPVETPAPTETKNPTPTPTPSTPSAPTPTTTPSASNTSDVVQQVIAGKFGNGAARKKALEAAGYNYNEVQQAVNQAMKNRNTGTTNTTIRNNTQNTNNKANTPYSPLSSANDYQNYNEYLNTLTQRQQSGYVDPNGQRHTGMSQNDFNQSYISGQQDIFDSRRNEVMANGETADQAFWRILNNANQNPGAYNEQQMDALRQMAQRLGYMDEAGNFADESGYAINMSFANPMSEQAFAQQTPGYNVSGGVAQNGAANNANVYTQGGYPYQVENGGHRAVNHPERVNQHYIRTQGGTGGAYDRFYL